MKPHYRYNWTTGWIKLVGFRFDPKAEPARMYRVAQEGHRD